MGSAAVRTAEPVRLRPAQRTDDDIEVHAQDRAYTAHQLRLGGVDWTEIAERTGYLDGRIASMAVTAWLQKIAIEQAPGQRRGALQLELDRLDQIQAAFWDLTLAGDYHAAEVVLKIVGRRCTIMGFDPPGDTDLTPPRTVLVTGSGEQHVATLQSLIAETEAARLADEHAPRLAPAR